MKRTVVALSLGFGVLTVSPMYYWLYTITGRTPPAKWQESVVGTWYSTDGEARLRVNARNMAEWTGLATSAEGKGAVVWDAEAAAMEKQGQESSLVHAARAAPSWIEVESMLPFIGKPTRLAVGPPHTTEYQGQPAVRWEVGGKVFIKGQ